MNSANELLDKKIEQGLGDKIAFSTPNDAWSYRKLYEKANQIAHVLQDNLGIVPGSRVLLRSPNNIMMVACWLAVLKAGAVAVSTMPLLRAKELVPVIEKGKISLALCDKRVAEEMENAKNSIAQLERICYFDGSGREKPGKSLKT